MQFTSKDGPFRLADGLFEMPRCCRPFFLLGGYGSCSTAIVPAANGTWNDR
jgi:hypothetical protein